MFASSAARNIAAEKANMQTPAADISIGGLDLTTLSQHDKQQGKAEKKKEKPKEMRAAHRTPTLVINQTPAQTAEQDRAASDRRESAPPQMAAHMKPAPEAPSAVTAKAAREDPAAAPAVRTEPQQESVQTHMAPRAEAPAAAQAEIPAAPAAQADRSNEPAAAGYAAAAEHNRAHSLAQFHNETQDHMKNQINERSAQGGTGLSIPFSAYERQAEVFMNAIKSNDYSLAEPMLTPLLKSKLTPPVFAKINGVMNDLFGQEERWLHKEVHPQDNGIQVVYEGRFEKQNARLTFSFVGENGSARLYHFTMEPIERTEAEPDTLVESQQKAEAWASRPHVLNLDRYETNRADMPAGEIPAQAVLPQTEPDNTEIMPQETPAAAGETDGRKPIRIVPHYRNDITPEEQAVLLSDEWANRRPILKLRRAAQTKNEAVQAQPMTPAVQAQPNTEAVQAQPNTEAVQAEESSYAKEVRQQDALARTFLDTILRADYNAAQPMLAEELAAKLSSAVFGKVSEEVHQTFGELQSLNLQQAVPGDNGMHLLYEGYFSRQTALIGVETTTEQGRPCIRLFVIQMGKKT